MDDLKRTVLRRSIPAILSAVLFSAAALSAAPVSAAETGAPVMDSILDEAVRQGSQRILSFRETGNPVFLQDASYFDPDEGEARSLAGEMPERFDLREQGLGRVTPVKSQSPFGTCWGFATIAAAETSILSELAAQGREMDPEKLNLSEKHLAWFSAHALPEDSDTGQGGEGTYAGPWSNEGYDTGGWMYYGTTAFASGVGPRSEEDVPYEPKDAADHILTDADGEPYSYDPNADWSVDESERFGIAFELEESSLLPSPASQDIDENGQPVYRYDETATNAIKSELMTGRGVSVMFCSDTFQYMNMDTWAHYTYDLFRPIDHAVTIVGWDDTYSVENFSEGHQPEGPGAWIVKNSWGAQSNSFPHKGNWGDEGYFYLSYYDRSIFAAESFDFFTGDTGHDHVYVDQYDYMTTRGIDIHDTDRQVSEANVFHAEDDMTLRAVAATTSKAGASVTYEVYRLREGYTSPTDGSLEGCIHAVYPYAGYHREDVAGLDKEVHFHKGESYSVVVTQESDGKYLYGAAVESSKRSWENLPEEEQGNASYSVGVINRGESFLGYRDAAGGAEEWSDWKDFTEGYMAAFDYSITMDNLAIKAYSDPYTFPPKTDLSAASITLDKNTYTYDGNAKRPVVTVKAAGKILEKGKDYTVSYKNNTKAGTATVTVTAKPDTEYTGARSVGFTIKKAAQTLRLNVSKKEHKVKDLKKKRASFTIRPSKNKTPVTYKVTKGAPRYISVSKKGVVTMEKGAKKGIYRVSVTARASTNYKSAKKTVTITVK